jgi:hypothetical protein
MDDELQKFHHVLSALPAEMVSQVIDLVYILPAKNQYEYFKTQLLDIHQLLDYEKFSKMEPMVGRKPSQLGADGETYPSTTSSCGDFPRPLGRS